MSYEAKDVERGLVDLARSARVAKVILRIMSVGVLVIWAALAVVVNSSMNTVATYNLSTVSVAFSFLQWLAVAVTLWVLSDVFAEIARGRSPFSRKTARKLCVAAVIMAVAVVANIVGPVWSVTAINASGGYFSFSQEPNVVVNFDLETVLGALLAVVLLGMSAIFRYGAMLQRVSDDTV